MKIFLKSAIIILTLLLLFCPSCSRNGKVENGTQYIYFGKSDKVKQSIDYKNGIKDGFAKEFYENGKLKAKQFYVKGVLNDSSVLYHPNGKVKSAQFYRNMKKEGIWKEYNKEGMLYKEICFKNNLLDSTSTEYTYRTGKVLIRVNYKRGFKHGLSELYYANGNPKSKVYYDDGEICKGTEEWQENGKKIDNDFKISVIEKNELLLNGKVTYYIKLQNPQKEDEAYLVVVPGSGNKVGGIRPLRKSGDSFLLEYNVGRGAFIMEQVTIAAYRKTSMGNTIIKTHSFNVSLNHF